MFCTVPCSVHYNLVYVCNENSIYINLHVFLLLYSACFFGEKKIASNFDYRSVGKCFSLICSPVVVVVAVVEATSTEWLVQATAAYPKPNLKSDLCYSDRLSSGHSSYLPLPLTHTHFIYLPLTPSYLSLSFTLFLIFSIYLNPS